VKAITTEAIFFDQGDLRSKPRSAGGTDQTRRPAAEHHEVITAGWNGAPPIIRAREVTELLSGGVVGFTRRGHAKLGSRLRRGYGIMERDATVAPRRGSRRNRLILLAVFVGLVATFYLTGLHEHVSWEGLRKQRDSWRVIVEQNLPVAAVAFVLIAVTLMSLSLPVGSILSLAAGALFDMWKGVGLIIIASAFGSTLAFLASRYLFRDFVRHWFGRWLTRVDRGIERDGAHYLLMLRLSPVVPFFAVNATMGLTKMRVGTFFWVSLIGILPSCFIYVLAGTELSQLQSPKDILSWELVGILCLLAFLPLIM
jgi:uncharacterized membrane protein YdjX (TVP38/TMEM64 family)